VCEASLGCKWIAQLTAVQKNRKFPGFEAIDQPNALRTWSSRIYVPSVDARQLECFRQLPDMSDVNGKNDGRFTFESYTSLAFGNVCSNITVMTNLLCRATFEQQAC